jgi:SAM-dependent methyltransferase
MDLRELPAGAFARHPWETARADFFVRLLRERLQATVGTALDVGAGDGYLARRLLGEAPGLREVTCFDPEYGPEWLQERPPAPSGLRFTRTWPEGTFDLVLLLDVLEHAADDQGLLAQAVGRAAAGAWVLLSAPAHPTLFSRHDVLLGHQRRYAPANLHALAVAAGLAVVVHGQLFASLLIPRAFAKVVERARAAPPEPGSAHAHLETSVGSWHHGRMVTKAVCGLLALDLVAGRLAARWGAPLPGLSTWVLARAP